MASFISIHEAALEGDSGSEFGNDSGSARGSFLGQVEKRSNRRAVHIVKKLGNSLRKGIAGSISYTFVTACIIQHTLSLSFILLYKLYRISDHLLIQRNKKVEAQPRPFYSP